MLMTIVAMCITLSAAQAQIQRVAALMIIEKSNGTITSEGSDDSVKHIEADIPQHHTEDFVKMDVADMVRKYSDISVRDTWHRRGDAIQISLDVDGNLVVVNYNKKINLMIIAWVCKE